MLIRKSNFAEHYPWVLASIIVFAMALIWFVFASLGHSEWPSGSSLPGFTFGVMGGLICLFEFLIWPRKKLRSWRIGKVSTWMRAHIWLGLLAVPLLVLHTGFRWGGPLSTTLMVLFLVVIASGVWGLVLQQFLPDKLLKEVPSETIFSQIDYVSDLMASEASRLVKSVCNIKVDVDDAGELSDDEGRHLVVGAVRSTGAIQGRVVVTASLQESVPDSKPLYDFFNEHIYGFLKNGEEARSPLAKSIRATVLFNSLRMKLSPRAHEVVAVLEDLCNQRRQLILQSKIQFWLHSWLWVHLPLSVALIVLMFVHVFVAMKYW
ncbi:MAG: hypothetical protein RL179_2674 [Planctomycetota bacterium]